MGGLGVPGAARECVCNYNYRNGSNFPPIADYHLEACGRVMAVGRRPWNSVQPVSTYKLWLQDWIEYLSKHRQSMQQSCIVHEWEIFR